MHIATGYPLYLAEARNRWYYYPAPYYSGGWVYATPWLWYDGNKHGSYTYSQWQTKINTEMNVPSPVTTTMRGAYNPATRHLLMNVQFRNDTTATLTNARAMMVITEDSIYQTGGSNGDYWHNHVARKYLPHQNGQFVTIAPGDSVTVTQEYILPSGWNAARCQIVAWLQNDVMKPDSTKPIYQGGLVNVSALPIEEIGLLPVVSSAVQAWPNPCVKGTAFSFSLSRNAPYTIKIFDITGRLVNRIAGIGKGVNEQVKWNRRDRSGQPVGSGVYLFRFESGEIQADGKIVVN